MSVEDFLTQLRARDIRLSLDGDRLKCSAPKGGLTPDLESEIVRRKLAIVGFLREAACPATATPIPKANRERPLPLSSAQERLWFLHRLQPESPAYNITAFVRIPGPVAASVLEASLREVVRKHESLRTSFTERAGTPVQVIHDELATTLAIADFSGAPAAEREQRWQRLLREHTRQPFDLRVAPLFRATLVRLAPEQHAFLVTIHHIVSDGWSLGIFFGEIGEVYRALNSGAAPGLAALPLQYADYVCWQRQELGAGALERDLSYWKVKLDKCPGLLELPADHPRPAVQGFEGAVARFSLPAAVASGLRELARMEGASLYMVLLAVFKALLFRYTRQTDLVVGSPLDGRSRPELEKLIGLFVNTLVLRTQLSDGITARELVRRVRETVLEAHAHGNLPFEKLVEALRPERTLSHSSLFQVAFILQNTPLSAAYETYSASSMFDLSLFMWEADGALGGAVEYSTELFEAGTIDRLASHFGVLAAAMAENPDRPVALLPVLTSAERTQQLDTWNQTATVYPRDRTIHDLFSEQARETPGAPALTIPAAAGRGERQVTYRELDLKSNRLARRLRALGVTHRTHVGIFLSRSLDSVVAILATLKAGGVYVPLDPAYPEGHLSLLLEPASLEVLVTSSHHLGRLPKFQRQILCLDRDQRQIDAEPSDALESGASAESPAYVMYTSGSTGRPKGVCVPHRAVVRLVKGTGYADFGSDEIFLAAAPISFDASTFEIWGSLLNGSRLVLVEQTLPTVTELANAIRDYRISTVWLTAGLFHQMVESHLEVLRTVRQILAGGDVLSVTHVNRVLESPGEGVLINGYGPTENTTFTCCHRMHRGTRVTHTVPIGRPIANTHVYVLDSDLQPVPVGVAGELFAGGDGLASEYWNDEAGTAAKFVPDPIGGVGRRLYRTGDLVRYRADGNLEFLGRADTQVKIRGFRIELDEIETVLRGHPEVQDAVAAVLDDGSGSKTLACYVVPRSGALEKQALAGLRQYLAERLPEYMLPSSFTALNALPLTANGKVDRKLLPTPVRTGEEAIGPRCALETQLLTIWQQVLDMHSIGIRDNFFDLGGHSLLAMKLLAQLEKVFGVLPVSLLFQAPSVEQMASMLADSGRVPPWRSLVAIQPVGSRPPLFLVPGVTGNVLSCTKLARALGADQPVYGLHSVGLDGRNQPFERIEDIAAHFVSEIRTVQEHGPYHLAGICMGGAVAYEMAQQLKARGEEVTTLALVETWPPAVLSSGGLRSISLVRPALFLLGRVWESLRSLWQMTPSERITQLRRKLAIVAGMVTRTRPHESYSRDLIHDTVEQANYCAITRYEPKPYAGRVLLIMANARTNKGAEDPRLQWAALTGGNCELFHLATTSAGRMLKDPWVQPLAERIRTSLAESTAVAGAFLA